MKKRFGLALLTFFLIIAVSGLFTTLATAQEPIRLGALYPRSGSLALLGEESWRGAEIARQLRNEAGGINGREIVFVNADVPNVNAARSDAERLISSERLQLLFGTYSSALAMAASEVAARRGVTFFELGAISDPITARGYDTVFRTNPQARLFARTQMRFIVDWLAERLGKAPSDIKLAIVYEDSDYGTSVADNMQKEAEAVGLPVASLQPYNAQSTDLSSVVLRLRSVNPDVIVAVSYAQDAILFWRQANELGLKVPLIGTGGGHSLTSFHEALGSLTDGVFNVDFTQYEVNTAFTPGLEEFVQLYQEKFGSYPLSGHSLANFMGANVVFDIIERANGSLAPDDIRAATMAYEREVGTTATGWGVQFDENGQNVRAEALVTQWRDGKLVTVWPEEAAVMTPLLIGN